MVHKKNNLAGNEGVAGSYRLSVISGTEKPMENGTTAVKIEGKHERAQWSNKFEFLMSCVAFSVGLGNVWRFPSTAYENGGGAFLIPYIIVLFIISKPVYYMEMILGQFSSRSCVEIWNVSPAFKGIGYGIAVSVFSVVTYYCSLMSVTLYYMLASCQSVLPWTVCWEEWGDECFSSTATNNETTNVNKSSSADLYFRWAFKQN